MNWNEEQMAKKELFCALKKMACFSSLCLYVFFSAIWNWGQLLVLSSFFFIQYTTINTQLKLFMPKLFSQWTTKWSSIDQQPIVNNLPNDQTEKCFMRFFVHSKQAEHNDIVFKPHINNNNQRYLGAFFVVCCLFVWYMLPFVCQPIHNRYCCKLFFSQKKKTWTEQKLWQIYYCAG